MLMQTGKYLLLAVVVLINSGCGYLFGDQGLFRDKSQDYKRAPEMPVLQVPQGKGRQALQEMYPIPPIRDELVLAGDFEVPRPTPLIAGATEDLVRIQKLGDKSWALINAAPGHVWPQLRSFLSASGIQLAAVDARAGLMDTVWLTLKDQPMASRFRFRIEQGVQRGTSELHVLQMNRAGDTDSWPETSDNAEQANQMLRAVAQYIANSADSAPVSMVAEQGIAASGKISLQEAPDGHPYIRLALPFDRAWASLGRALEKSTFKVEDLDRSAGLYYARFVGPDAEEGSGWFDWLFGGDEDPLTGRLFLISMEKVDDATVTIRLRPQGEDAGFGKREEQSLLVLIKGNIN